LKRFWRLKRNENYAFYEIQEVSVGKSLTNVPQTCVKERTQGDEVAQTRIRPNAGETITRKQMMCGEDVTSRNTTTKQATNKQKNNHHPHQRAVWQCWAYRKQQANTFGGNPRRFDFSLSAKTSDHVMMYFDWKAHFQ
jgi:hypothetical protein